jgi:hypothetical protein
MPLLAPNPFSVIPAKAGIHLLSSSPGKEDWIPAFAGMTSGGR